MIRILWIGCSVVFSLLLAMFAGIFRSLFGDPLAPLRNATQLAMAGKYPEAADVLTTALNTMPPAPQCKGKTAEARFLLLALLSEVIRRSTEDAERELEVLNECATLADQVPPPPPGPDPQVNQVYMIHLNRGNAAGRTNRHLLAEQAYAAALEAARDPETHCKCLAYQGWAIIRQKDNAKFPHAQACFDRFDKIGFTFGKFLDSEGKTISPLLVSYVWLGRAILFLYQNNVAEARRACEQSIQTNPAPARRRQLLELLRRPGSTAAEGIRFFWEGRDDEQPGMIVDKSLSPLPEDI